MVIEYVAGIYLLFSLIWLRQFVKGCRFFQVSDEFDEITAEIEKRLASGAPAEELIEMAKDRLKKM